MADVMEQQVVGTQYTYSGYTATIGERCEPEVVAVLPQGALINLAVDPHEPLMLIEKGLDGLWHRTHTGGVVDMNRRRNNELWAVPEGLLGRQETIDEYKARFHAKALKALERQLGRRHDADIDALLGRLGLAPLVDYDGMVVRRGDMPNLPDGVVVMAFDPSSPNYHVWEKRNGQWVREFGRNFMSPADLDQVTVIDTPDLGVRHEPNDTDADEIAAFKAKAWAEGWALKTRRGWCGAYEQVMRDVGLTAADSMPDFSTFPESDTWQDLPVGAVLGYTGHSRWDLAVRDNNSDYGLRRVAGTSTGRLGRNTWRVLWNGQGQMSIPLPFQLLGLVPVGGQVRSPRNHGIWTKQADGLWRGENGERGNEHTVEGGTFHDRDRVVHVIGLGS